MGTKLRLSITKAPGLKPGGLAITGAEGGSRTPTPVKAADFEFYPLVPGQ